MACSDLSKVCTTTIDANLTTRLRAQDRLGRVSASMDVPYENTNS
jgi:hypothetical protein